MSTPEFLVVSIVAVTGLYFLAESLWSPKPDAKEKSPRESTRWKRFRLRPGPLHGGDREESVIEQIPKGLQLTVRSGRSDDLPMDVVGEEGDVLLRFEYPLLTLRGGVLIRLEREHWLRLLPCKRGFPELEATAPRPPRDAPAKEQIRFQGDLDRREYEIRLGGRLVASISWQQGERGSEAAKGTYMVEIVKSAPLLPTLSLVLALEILATLGGSPARIEG